MYVRRSLCLHHSTLPHHPHPFIVLQLPQAATPHRFTNAPWSALVSRFIPRQAHNVRPMVFVSASLHCTSPSSPLYRATTATSSNDPQIHKCCLVSFGKQIHASTSAQRTSDGLCVCITPLYLAILTPLPCYNCHEQQRPTDSQTPQIHKCPLVSFGKQIHASPSAPCTSDGLCVCITPLYLTLL